MTDEEVADVVNGAAGFDLLTRRSVQGLRGRAPWKLGRGSKTSLPLLVAWLKATHDKGEFLKPSGKTKGERQRASVSRANDIESILGKMPAVKNPKRKEKCKTNLALYLTTYHPETFDMPFSDEHLAMLKRLEMAMVGFSTWMLETAFRSFGKTSLAEGAAAWAINYGHRRFVPIIGPDEDHAAKVSQSIQREYESNDLLCEDFPEICWGVRALEGKFQRCASQSFRGKLTNIEWNSKTLVFPMIEGSPAGGTIIRARGYTGRIRGMRHKRADGVVLRPDCAIVEDPITEATAKSKSGNDNFLDILINGVLGLTGHTRRISVVVPATIIKKGDAIDQLASDKDKYGAWVHNNTPMMKTMPDRLDDLWLVQYAEIRRAFDPEVPGDQQRAHEASNAFYKKHRKDMDAGADVTWNHCFDETEISAIQHAMNILIDKGEEYFASECQGKPIDTRAQGIFELDEDVISKRTNGLPRFTVPAPSQIMTAFVDVGHQKLHWMVTGWSQDFCGHIPAYGEYPEGKQPLWDQRYESLAHGITEGLKNCLNHICSLKFTRDDGEDISLDRILVDCGDPLTRSEVFSVCRGERFGCSVLPSRGRAHHKFKLPSDKKTRVFLNCYADTWKTLGRLIIHDACLWRERWQKGIMSPEGTRGAVRIYGQDKVKHPQLASHLCGERLVEKFIGETGEIYKWYRVPGYDNHWLDCAVGCAVAAAVEGMRYTGQVTKAGAKRKKKRGGFRSIG